jgi:vacuolar protein sorting-associated protein 52
LTPTLRSHRVPHPHKAEIDRFNQDPLIKEKGANLREYAMQLETDLMAMQESQIVNYVVATSKTIDTTRQLKECCSILNTMEQRLREYQENLTKVD